MSKVLLSPENFSVNSIVGQSNLTTFYQDLTSIEGDAVLNKDIYFSVFPTLKFLEFLRKITSPFAYYKFYSLFDALILKAEPSASHYFSNNQLYMTSGSLFETGGYLIANGKYEAFSGALNRIAKYIFFSIKKQPIGTRNYLPIASFPRGYQMTFLSTSASREIIFKELISGNFVEISGINSIEAHGLETFLTTEGSDIFPYVRNWSFITTSTGAIINFTVSTYPAIVKVEFYDARTLNLLKSAYYHLEDRIDHTTFFPILPGDYIVKVFTINQYNPQPT
jgi:hypothetical protein